MLAANSLGANKVKKAFAIALVLLATAAALASSVSPLQSDQAEAELVAEAERASGDKRAKLYLKLSERSLNLAKTEYDNGNSDQGHAALEKFMGYAREAFRTARDTGKHIKQTEIALRKFGRKLEDIKRSLNFEEQKPISEIEPEIQRMRDELMRKMWQK
jgi:hypothetical protein